MAKRIFALQCKEASKRLEGAKEYIEKILQKQLKDPGFGLYIKYDAEQDVITLYSSLPKDSKDLGKVVIDSLMFDTKEREGAGFQIVKDSGQEITEKDLNKLTKEFQILITGPLDNADMADCFEEIERNFENFERQAKARISDRLKPKKRNVY